MSFLRKKPLLALGLLILLLIGIPAAIFLSQRSTDERTQAAAATNISFAPSSNSSSPITVQSGNNVSIDIMLDPGTNQVSYFQSEITYDPSKFQVVDGNFVVNANAFPTTISGPSYASGKVTFAVSVGADGTKVIQSPAKVGTLTLKALSSQGTSQVNFINPQALSIDPDSTPRENVISGTSPAFLSVTGETVQTPTCSDNIDNNNNNLIDEDDPACHTDGDPDNPDTYDPDLPEEGNTCADGIDNNENNLIDANDPICHTDGDPQNPDSYDPTLPETGGNGTALSLTVFQHGIGNSGDNANPTAHSLSNKEPLTQTIPAQVFVYNTANELVSNTTGQLSYNSTNGNYTGTVMTANPLDPGPYNVRVQTPRHLIRRLPGIQNIVSSGNNALSAVHLITGDVNSDNHLNILDYNTLIGCYSDTSPAVDCDDSKKSISDTNDDGVVNQVDYNLFLREIANQPGD